MKSKLFLLGLLLALAARAEITTGPVYSTGGGTTYTNNSTDLAGVITGSGVGTNLLWSTNATASGSVSNGYSVQVGTFGWTNSQTYAGHVLVPAITVSGQITTIAKSGTYLDTLLLGNNAYDGSGLTNLNATELRSGTVADARLSANVTVLGNTVVATNNGNNNFSAGQTIAGIVTTTSSFVASNSAAVGTTNLQLLPSIIRVISPAQASASVAGSPLAISAANATAGSSSAGAAAGGSVAINGGNAAQLTSGNANGGALTFTSGNAAGFGAPGDFTVTLGSAPNGFNTVPVITLSTPNSAVPGKISLTTGNSTIQTSAGGTGGDVTVANGSGGDLFTSGATGYRGGQFTVTAGTGGGSGFSTGTQTGGAGGQATLTSGTGGAVATPTTIGVGGAGGAGGYTLGNGGAVTGTTGTQTGGAGGAFTVAGGTGGAVAGTAGATGGAGSSITNRSGVGGAASGASGTRTGGASGNIVYQIGAAGTGASANGVVGVVQFEVPSNTVMVQITSTNVQIQGVTDASASVAGKFGEYAESLVASGSAISLTTATVSNITSLSLTAGDWDVSGNVNIAGATATYTQGLGGISTTSATVPTDGTEVYSGAQFTLLSVTDGFTLPRKRINVSSTTTVYLVAKATFSAGTMTGYGSISARRVR